MQNLIIELGLASPLNWRLKLMWTPHISAPLTNFLLVGVDCEPLAATLWQVFGEHDADRTGLTTQESFARELNFQYYQVGKTLLTPLQTSLSAMVVVQIIRHTSSMINAQVRLMGTKSPDVIFTRTIKSVTNHVYVPR